MPNWSECMQPNNVIIDKCYHHNEEIIQSFYSQQTISVSLAYNNIKLMSI